jgi:mevalonate kinase
MSKNPQSHWKSFETTTPGKWVLSGEHTVLRGGAAIALPHPEFKLKFYFEPSLESLSVIPDLASVATQDLLRVARDWLKSHGITMLWPKGEIMIESTIPFGAGLGSSAAFSVAVARWILTSHDLPLTLEIELAKNLEDRFHGKSSGMDVSVVSLGRPILFSMKDGARILDLKKLPQFRFQDTGIRSSTRDCIERVEKLQSSNPELARDLDARMKIATAEMLEGLSDYEKNPKPSLEKIVHAMNSSFEVFEAWGLNPPEVEPILSKEKHQGALASRLTGAGGGGVLVSVVC